MDSPLSRLTSRRYFAYWKRHRRQHHYGMYRASNLREMERPVRKKLSLSTSCMEEVHLEESNENTAMREMDIQKIVQQETEKLQLQIKTMEARWEEYSSLAKAAMDSKHTFGGSNEISCQSCKCKLRANMRQEDAFLKDSGQDWELPMDTAFMENCQYGGVQARTVQDECSQLNNVQDKCSQANNVQDECSQLNNVQDKCSQAKNIQDECSQANNVQDECSQANNVQDEFIQMDKLQRKEKVVKCDEEVDGNRSFDISFDISMDHVEQGESICSGFLVTDDTTLQHSLMAMGDISIDVDEMNDGLTNFIELPHMENDIDDIMSSALEDIVIKELPIENPTEYDSQLQEAVVTIQSLVAKLALQVQPSRRCKQEVHEIRNALQLAIEHIPLMNEMQDDLLSGNASMHVTLGNATALDTPETLVENVDAPNIPKLNRIDTSSSRISSNESEHNINSKQHLNEAQHYSQAKETIGGTIVDTNVNENSTPNMPNDQKPAVANDTTVEIKMQSSTNSVSPREKLDTLNDSSSDIFVEESSLLEYETMPPISIQMQNVPQNKQTMNDKAIENKQQNDEIQQDTQPRIATCIETKAVDSNPSSNIVTNEDVVDPVKKQNEIKLQDNFIECKEQSLKTTDISKASSTLPSRLFTCIQPIECTRQSSPLNTSSVVDHVELYKPLTTTIANTALNNNPQKIDLFDNSNDIRKAADRRIRASAQLIRQRQEYQEKQTQLEGLESSMKNRKSKSYDSQLEEIRKKHDLVIKEYTSTYLGHEKRATLLKNEAHSLKNERLTLERKVNESNSAPVVRSIAQCRRTCKSKSKVKKIKFGCMLKNHRTTSKANTVDDLWDHKALQPEATESQSKLFSSSMFKQHLSLSEPVAPLENLNLDFKFGTSDTEKSFTIKYGSDTGSQSIPSLVKSFSVNKESNDKETRPFILSPSKRPPSRQFSDSRMSVEELTSPVSDSLMSNVAKPMLPAESGRSFHIDGLPFTGNRVSQREPPRISSPKSDAAFKIKSCTNSSGKFALRRGLTSFQPHINATLKSFEEIEHELTSPRRSTTVSSLSPPSYSHITEFEKALNYSKSRLDHCRSPSSRASHIRNFISQTQRASTLRLIRNQVPPRSTLPFSPRILSTSIPKPSFEFETTREHT